MSTMLLIAQSYDKTGGSWMQMAEVLKTWKSGCQSFERCRTAYLDYQYLICQLEASFSVLQDTRVMWLAEMQITNDLLGLNPLPASRHQRMNLLDCLELSYQIESLTSPSLLQHSCFPPLFLGEQRRSYKPPRLLLDLYFLDYSSWGAHCGKACPHPVIYSGNISECEPDASHRLHSGDVML